MVIFSYVYDVFNNLFIRILLLNTSAEKDKELNRHPGTVNNSVYVHFGLFLSQ